MTEGLHVCFVTANTFEYDSRTLRAAQALAADGHRVTVVALQGPGLAVEAVLDGGIRLVRPALDRRISSAFLPLPMGVRRWLSAALGFDVHAVASPPRRGGILERVRGPIRRAAEILAYRRRVGPWERTVTTAAPDADVFSAKALVVLPVIRAAAARTGARFVYDIADLHIESGRLARLPGPLKTYLHRRERDWMAEAAALTTVTAPMADEIARRFGVARPTVVMNCRPRWRAAEPMPRPGRLREAVVAAGGSPDAPIVLYQGAFREDQGIEELLVALDGSTLRDIPCVVAFMGFGRLEARLRAAAAGAPSRIVVLPPVPSAELLDWTAGADLAFVGAPPKTINLGLTIPNKLFESLMAGVPVVVAGDTAVARLVTETGAGIVVQPWSATTLGPALAAALTATPGDRLADRQHARTAALERYNWEAEQVGLLATYRELHGRRAGSEGGVGRRVVLLLNNTFTADSRSWKLATSLTEAGCQVVVVARPGDGLPWTEERDGYRVLRVAQPRTLSWLPAPGLPGTPLAGDPVATGAARGARARVRDTVGRGAQAGRYLLRTRAWAKAIDTAVGAASVDIWQSEGLVTLPVALRLRSRRGGKVVYDSRDIHLESARFALLPGPWRALLARRERSWAQAADAVVTVNVPYAQHLERALGRPMTLVFNGPLSYDPPDPPDRRIHRELDLPATAKVALVLGAVVAHRGIDEAVLAVGELPDVHLVVIGEGGAKPAIQARAAGLTHANRIHFMPAAPPDEIPAWTAAADVVVIPIQPSTLNHRLTTPTRLFDAMGAGVPVVASDLPGMAAIIRETGIGVLVDPTSPSAIAAGIREILDASPERRAASTEASLASARGPYAWDRGVERLLDLYRRLG